MPNQIYDNEVVQALHGVQDAVRQAQRGLTQARTALIDGQPVQVPSPFPSPGDWRDCWIYFLMLDRFNNPEAPPKSTLQNPPMAWNGEYIFRQGGTFKGVQAQLDYIASLGARAIWLSPVLKNPRPDWKWNYHGYAAQDFLNLDERFASDGTRATAEREFAELVTEAHARGLYVIVDIVLNHAGRVFDYVLGDATTTSFKDAALLDGPLGNEPPIRWLNGLGFSRDDWQDFLPAVADLSPDDAVWPQDLQRKEFFRRRGEKVTDSVPPGGFVRGDFGDMRQLVGEYDAQPESQASLRAAYGRWPVLNILVQVHQYLIARYDIDGYRIDTVKYVAPDVVRSFGNAIREYALSIGKSNFFTFGEIADESEEVLANFFVGRNSTQIDGFGIDAALDFPLTHKLVNAVKAQGGVEELRHVFDARKRAQQNLISSHGESGRYFVTFLDNHDQNERFYHPDTPLEQVQIGLAMLFTLQGIPCIYYGTEQELRGASGTREAVREALWGKPDAFATTTRLYQDIQQLALIRREEPALRYGRFYFREVARDGGEFGHSFGAGGVIAFSRILADREVLVVANTSTSQPAFQGHVIVDLDLSRQAQKMTIRYSNSNTTGDREAEIMQNAVIHRDDGSVTTTQTAALPVKLEPKEVQIFVPR